MKAFKDFISRIIDPNVTWDNEYNPEVRVSKTIRNGERKALNRH